MSLAGRSVLLCGATGLVGRECLRLLARDNAYARVIVISRRPLPDADRLLSARIEAHVVDFDRLAGFAELFGVDEIVCALGTTLRQAGSQERFRAVDYGYTLQVARLGLERGADHFLLVSAIGADPRSRTFYSRVKGETEEAVAALPFNRVTMVRPSLLLGDRQEFRLGEEIGKRLAFLIPRRYKPVHAAAVAAALLQAGRENAGGRRVVESAEIPELCARYGRTDD